MRFVLLAAGTTLVFLGARDLIESELGQQTAARNFPRAASLTRTTFPRGSPAPPHLRIGETVARLSIPRLNTELYVVEGDDDRELRRGPGHIPGTAPPGATGNTVIAGHRDTHFRVLKDIRRGDTIRLQTPTKLLRYSVERTFVVAPSDTASLQPTKEPELHLVTCYPFYWVGNAPERFVVEARLVSEKTRLE